MFKKGFTLAEILICLGIMAIITGVGASIAKKSTQAAYDMYWKSGYANLYDALLDVIIENRAITDKTEMNKALSKILTDKEESEEEFTTINGIKYLVDDDNGNGTFYITMSVPQPKRKSSDTGYKSASFIFNKDVGVLIPLPFGGENLQESPLLNLTIVNNQHNSSNSSYNKPESCDFKNCACKVYGSLDITIPSKYVQTADGTSTNPWDVIGRSSVNQGWTTGSLVKVLDCTSLDTRTRTVANGYSLVVNH